MWVGGKFVAAPPSIKPPEQPKYEGPEVIEPTRDEERNGWTAEKLTEYFHNRAAQQVQYQSEVAAKTVRDAKTESTSGFDPHRWGR